MYIDLLRLEFAQQRDPSIDMIHVFPENVRI